MSKLDSPRLASLNESFRSISSYNSTPVVTPRNREVARLSYDGRETKGGRVSGVKLKDLPRLSLDSKQRTRKDSSLESKDDFLGNLKRNMQGSNETETEIKEPMSYRAPSNIVAKLMGLQALPAHDVASANNNQVEQYGSHKYDQSCDALSRSSSIINESKVGLYSPRSTWKESGVLQSIEAKAEQTASIDQEAHIEPKSHSLTVYGAMEKSLADLNFQKSGKDLRALKQILESMHKGEKELEFRLENQSSDGESQTNSSSSFHISQKQGLKTASPAINKDRNRCVNEVKSTMKIKPTKVVKGSRKANQVVRDMPIKSPQRLRILQEPVEGNKKVSLKKKKAKDVKEVHHTLKRYSGEKNPRPVRASKPMTKTNMTKSAKVPDYRSPSAPTSSYEVKQSNQFMGSSAFSNDPACLSQQENANLIRTISNSSTVSHVNTVVINAEESCKKYEALQQQSDNKNPEEVRGDKGFEELKITTVREQPSPVSVLDANFFEDESPSPIKKKYIAFRDFDTNATDTEPEWNYTGLTHSSDGTRPGFSFQDDCQKSDNFKESAPDVQILSSYQQENLSSTTPHYRDACLERSYVYEVLLASGFLDDPNYTMVEQLVHQSQEAINPNLFYVLEQTKGSSFVSYQRFDGINKITRTNERHSRRLLFDAVNDILTYKTSQPKPLLKKQSELSTNGPQLLHEVFKELDLLQAINWPQRLDDEEDFLKAIIGKELTHRSANWTDVSAEIPALALDIERLIFKDLIVELVHSKCAEIQAQKH